VGVDDDCDGSVDEGCQCTDGQSRPCPLQQGVCAGSSETCAGGAWPGCDYPQHNPEFQPPPEDRCDALDNDCDGVADGIHQPCSAQHQGLCAVGVETCTDGVWGGCPVAVPEDCNQLDDDCDGLTDAGDPDLRTTLCELSQGVCGGGLTHAQSKCVDGQWQVCDATEYGGAYGQETCTDSLDNDCDGASDCGQPVCEGATRACANQCLAGVETCTSGSWGSCTAPGVEDEGERHGNCDDGLDNDCDGHQDGDDPECCGTTGAVGTLALLVLLPMAMVRHGRTGRRRLDR
jgi:hypothetical protein